MRLPGRRPGRPHPAGERRLAAGSIRHALDDPDPEIAFWRDRIAGHERLVWVGRAQPAEVLDRRAKESVILLPFIAITVTASAYRLTDGGSFFPLVVIAAAVFLIAALVQAPVLIEELRCKAMRYAATTVELFATRPFRAAPERLTFSPETRLHATVSEAGVTAAFRNVDADGRETHALAFEKLDAAQLEALYRALGLRWPPRQDGPGDGPGAGPDGGSGEQANGAERPS